IARSQDAGGTILNGSCKGILVRCGGFESYRILFLCPVMWPRSQAAPQTEIRKFFFVEVHHDTLPNFAAVQCRPARTFHSDKEFVRGNAIAFAYFTQIQRYT